MKIAVTGKGGVGKTTLSAVLCHLYAEEGRRVIAVDADPDANLASALGIPGADAEKIRPISDMADLIEERTGVRPGGIGGMYKLNPRVDDLPEGIGYKHNGITLLTMGKIKAASSGCYCSENVLLRSLLKHLIVERSEVVIVDMEAGIEHLTRGTAESVEAFIVVVEPGQRSMQTARTVSGMARELGIKKVFVVANKVRGAEDLEFIREKIGDLDIVGSLSFSHAVVEADMSGASPYHFSKDTVKEVRALKEKIEKGMNKA
ncbi:MAG TPA: carbon monoxide dehydrogenase accessory protein CooC [Thermodesulfovibrionales bacterium]|nr:carbon monoxide dehydrogenase accessory protein CooC [Thermodesulfovibrionales bacterium]